MHFYTNVTEHRSKLLVTGYLDGKRYQEVINYRPYLFIRNPSDQESRYRTIHGVPVTKKNFNSIWDARQYIREYGEVDGFEIFGLDKFNYVYINDTFPNIQYDLSLIKLAILDIEVATDTGFPDIDLADKEVTAITVMYKDVTFVFGLKDYQAKDNNVKYIWCKSEEDLLKKFLKLWTSDAFRPDVVTGWNIEFFDIPYIIRRIALVLGEEDAKKLSPFGVLRDRVVEVFGKPHTVFMPLGLNILDYLQLYKKFTYVMRDSYKLDNIAEIELGEKKIDYSVYGSLNELYIQNHDLFIEYNIHDCTLIKKLEHKLQLLALVYEFSYDSGTNFEDSLRPVRTWDIIIHNHLMKVKKVIPQYKKSDISFGNPVGAHVKNAIPNGYEWVVSFDLTSLYPHLIIGYNISPDTFKGKIKKPFSVDQLLDMEHLDQYLQYIKDNNLSFAANGCLYDNNKQGFLGELMQDLFDKRKLYKKKMLEEKQQFEKTHDPKHTFMIAKYNNLQQNAKIKLNSCYGAMLNEGFRYYSKDFAESITISGQLTIRWAEKKLNEFLNQHNGTIGKDYIIASDTDSCYINMKDLVDKQNLPTTKDKVDWINSFCEEKIQPYLDTVYQELANNMNCFKQAMHMKRESICEKGLFFAKKRYVLRSWDDEGVRYEKPKTKMTGIEAVRSTTPSSVRAAIKECIDIILDGDEQKTRQYIKDFREKFETLPFYEIAFTRGINGLEKYADHHTIYKKATPIHVRAALLYNKTLERFSLVGKYNLIVEKDKVKFCYMRMPNPIHENVFGAPGELPKELDLEKYIDYDQQFDKAFLDPIKSILQVLKWQHEDQDTLAALFGGEIS